MQDACRVVVQSPDPTAAMYHGSAPRRITLRLRRAPDRGGATVICDTVLREGSLPELPEVETIARGLETRLPGRRILSVRLSKTDFIDDPVTLEARVPGSRILGVRRHGKFLVLDLESDSPVDSHVCLLVHLGMTGQLTARQPDEPVSPHTHAFFALDDGQELRYTDIRRFGRMLLACEPVRAEVLGKLGLDPLEASAEEFRAQIARRRVRIKALFLDQHVFRGLGNIYTDESLWRARIHPMRLAAGMKREEVARLQKAVRSVLSEAIRSRGSSVSDYVDANGEPGEFQRCHRVYQREGEKCFRCGAKIRRAIVAGRSSYFCPRCQPAPRARRKSPLGSPHKQARHRQR
jgi:formamidopyrimidine-DNA glycosylase